MAFNKDNAISVSFTLNADILSAGEAYGVVLARDYTYTLNEEMFLLSALPYTPSWGISDSTWEIRESNAINSYTFTDKDPGSSDGALRVTAFNPSQGADLDIAGLSVAASNPVGNSLVTYDLAVYRGLFTYPRKQILALGHAPKDTVKYPTAHGAGTLAKHCYDQCELLIAGKEPGSDTTDLWVTYPTFVPHVDNFPPVTEDIGWNPNLFIPRSLLTGISVMIHSYQLVKDDDDVVIDEYWRNEAYKSGTMISPIHLIGANHYHGQVGEQYTFMDEAGVMHTRTVVARQWVGSLASYSALYGVQPHGTDIDCIVSILDAEIPNCKIYQMLPEQWIADYAPDLSQGTTSSNKVRPDFPHIRHVRHTITKDGVSEPTAPGKMTMQIAAITGTSETGTDLAGAPPDKNLYINYSNMSTFSEWGHLRRTDYLGDLMSWSYLEGGDSGCPEFVPIDLGLGGGVDLFILGFGKDVSGITNCSNALTFINEAMQILSDGQGNTQGYQTSAPDLSQFTKYT